MTLPALPRWAPSVGLVLLVVAAVYGYGCHERQIGAAKAAEAAAKQDAKVAAESIAALHLQRAALLGPEFVELERQSPAAAERYAGRRMPAPDDWIQDQGGGAQWLGY